MRAGRVFPFSAVCGQERLKLALKLNAVNPRICGVLISGEKGTAKSTLVRSLADIIGKGSIVEIPLNVTEDRLVGTLDLSDAVNNGGCRFEKGIFMIEISAARIVREWATGDDQIAPGSCMKTVGMVKSCLEIYSTCNGSIPLQ